MHESHQVLQADFSQMDQAGSKNTGYIYFFSLKATLVPHLLVGGPETASDR